MMLLPAATPAAGTVKEVEAPLLVAVVVPIVWTKQIVPARFVTSAGHVALVPVQASAASHSSAATRQTEPAFPAGCVQVAPLPLQMSREQTFPSSVQAVPFALKLSAGQAALVPVHVSATSHSSTAARQAVPE